MTCGVRYLLSRHSWMISRENLKTESKRSKLSEKNYVQSNNANQPRKSSVHKMYLIALKTTTTMNELVNKVIETSEV